MSALPSRTVLVAAAVAPATVVDTTLLLMFEGHRHGLRRAPLPSEQDVLHWSHL